MKLFCVAFITCLGVALVLACPTANAQTNKTFPTDDEIALVVTQTERALSDYEETVKTEEKLGSKEADLANDKRVIKGLALMSKGIGSQPQRFNSGLGLTFVLRGSDGMGLQGRGGV
jgi:hypothetical protein